MRVLMISAAILAASAIISPAQAGGWCTPPAVNCAVEDRSVSAVSITEKVTVTVEISQANWDALFAHWRAKGKTGKCFWYASSKQGDKTERVYGPRGDVTVYRGRQYAYNGRIHWEIFGPF